MPHDLTVQIVIGVWWRLDLSNTLLGYFETFPGLANNIFVRIKKCHEIDQVLRKSFNVPAQLLGV